MDKIAALNEILAQDASNPLARYGLALELAHQGQTDAALEQFDRLLALHPQYVAGYFMSAQTMAQAGRTVAAIDRLKTGIQRAAQSGNHHAQSEMQAMLDELQG